MNFHTILRARKKFSAWSTPPYWGKEKTQLDSTKWNFEHNVNDWKVRKMYVNELCVHEQAKTLRETTTILGFSFFFFLFFPPTPSQNLFQFDSKVSKVFQQFFTLSHEFFTFIQDHVDGLWLISLISQFSSLFAIVFPRNICKISPQRPYRDEILNHIKLE